MFVENKKKTITIKDTQPHCESKDPLGPKCNLEEERAIFVLIRLSHYLSLLRPGETLLQRRRYWP